MDAVDASRLMAAARAAVGVDDDARAAWRRVSRLDGRPDYVLVGISHAAAPSGSCGWVVSLSLSGEIQAVADDPAGADAWWVAVVEELVWAPGSGSMSRFYPLRRQISDGRPLLVDHTGATVEPHSQRHG